MPNASCRQKAAPSYRQRAVFEQTFESYRRQIERLKRVSKPGIGVAELLTSLGLLWACFGPFLPMLNAHLC